MNAEELAQKLYQETDLTTEQIRIHTQQKIDEYEPLVTDKSAAVILLGQEHGVDLVETQKPELEIQNIVPGISNIELEAKIKNIDKFTYTKDGEKKKGCEIILSDDTGTISMMVWGEQVEKIDQGLEGEKVKIVNSYSSKYQGQTQLQYGSDTQISKM